MKVRLIGVREQFEVVGLMRKPCIRGATVQFDLSVLRAEGSPDEAAKVVFTVLPPADPVTDYMTPEFYLDNVKIDWKVYRFNVSTLKALKLTVRVYIRPTARWFSEFVMDVEVVRAEGGE